MIVYVLYSLSHDRHYIGCTHDIEKRIRKHNSGSVRSTKAYRPWKVVYTEVCSDKTTALQRELYLKKNGRERDYLIQMIHNGPIV